MLTIEKIIVSTLEPQGNVLWIKPTKVNNKIQYVLHMPVTPGVFEEVTVQDLVDAELGDDGLTAKEVVNNVLKLQNDLEETISDLDNTKETLSSTVIILDNEINDTTKLEIQEDVTNSGLLKSYKIYYGGTLIKNIDIPLDMVVSSSSYDAITNRLTLTIANSDTPVIIDLNNIFQDTSLFIDDTVYTRDELLTKANNDLLVPGRKYKLNYFTNENIVEVVLLLTATSTNRFDIVCQPIANPNSDLYFVTLLNKFVWHYDIVNDKTLYIKDAFNNEFYNVDPFTRMYGSNEYYPLIAKYDDYNENFFWNTTYGQSSFTNNIFKFSNNINKFYANYLDDLYNVIIDNNLFVFSENCEIYLNGTKSSYKTNFSNNEFHINKITNSFNYNSYSSYFNNNLIKCNEITDSDFKDCNFSYNCITAITITNFSDACGSYNHIITQTINIFQQTNINFKFNTIRADIIAISSLNNFNFYNNCCFGKMVFAIGSLSGDIYNNVFNCNIISINNCKNIYYNVFNCCGCDIKNWEEVNYNVFNTYSLTSSVLVSCRYNKIGYLSFCYIKNLQKSNINTLEGLGTSDSFFDFRNKRIENINICDLKSTSKAIVKLQSWMYNNMYNNDDKTILSIHNSDTYTQKDKIFVNYTDNDTCSLNVEIFTND